MRFLIALLIILNTIELNAQAKAFGPHDLDSLLMRSEKPTLIFIHADWCKFCALMKESTLSNDEVIEALQQRVNYVSFNAEFKEDVIVDNRTFTYFPIGTSGKHQLALELGMMQGQLELPVVTIMNNKQEIVFQNSGYMDVDEMKRVLNSLF